MKKIFLHAFVAVAMLSGFLSGYAQDDSGAGYEAIDALIADIKQGSAIIKHVVDSVQITERDQKDKAYVPILGKTFTGYEACSAAAVNYSSCLAFAQKSDSACATLRRYGTTDLVEPSASLMLLCMEDYHQAILASVAVSQGKINTAACAKVLQEQRLFRPGTESRACAIFANEPDADTALASMKGILREEPSRDSIRKFHIMWRMLRGDSTACSPKINGESRNCVVYVEFRKAYNGKNAALCNSGKCRVMLGEPPSVCESYRAGLTPPCLEWLDNRESQSMLVSRKALSYRQATEATRTSTLNKIARAEALIEKISPKNDPGLEARRMNLLNLKSGLNKSLLEFKTKTGL